MASLGNHRFSGQYFQQCSDIDFSSSPNHVPLNIGGTSGFEGVYNGMGRVIKNLGRTSPEYTSGFCDEGMVFSSINASGTAWNLGVQNASAVFGGAEDRSSCGFGILAGKNAGTLQNVWTSGTVKISTTVLPPVGGFGGYGGAVVGGVVGVQTGTILLKNLWSTASVEMFDQQGGYPAFLGGLIGYGDVSIADSFFAGTISRDLSGQVSQFSSITTAGGIVAKGSVSGSNLFNIGTIGGGNHDKDSLTGIAEKVFHGTAVSNFGPLTSTYGASYGVAESIGDGSGGTLTVSNLRNYGVVSGVGAYGIVGTIKPNAQVSQVYSFGNLLAHTGVAAANPSEVLTDGAYGFARIISGSAEKVGVINGIFLDEAAPADLNCGMSACPPLPYEISSFGIALQITDGGSLSKSFYIGEANLTNPSLYRSFEGARFFGIVRKNQGSVDQVYSVLLKQEGFGGGQEACIESDAGTATHVYTWVDSEDPLAGRSQDYSPYTRCHAVKSKNMLIDEGFPGFDFVTPVWTIPGRYWPTPGF
jgi:hypothetical protein